MLTTKVAFDYFINLRGKDYPYSALKQTRNQLYFKWMIVTSRGDDIPRRRTPYEAVLASSFDRPTLQHLVISGRGLPLPPAMGLIMDWMQSWGRNRSQGWYEATLELFVWYMDEKIDVSERELIFEVISIKVKEEIHSSFITTQLLGWSTYNEWHDYFNFHYDSGKKEFFGLATKSIGYVRDRIETVVEAATQEPTPTYTSSNGQATSETVSP